jgi:hypothetical protein
MSDVNNLIKFRVVAKHANGRSGFRLVLMEIVIVFERNKKISLVAVLVVSWVTQVAITNTPELIYCDQIPKGYSGGEERQVY